MPHLRRLAADTGETANLQVLDGAQVRFIESVEGHRLLRVGSRKGKRLPAHRVSGGLILLAELAAEEVRARCRDIPDDEMKRLLQELSSVRTRGYAINDEQTEHGVSAVAVPVGGASGRSVGALALALPSSRFGRTSVEANLAAMRKAAVRVRDDYLRRT